LTIRRGTPADARQIAEVHVASWRAGYKDLVEGNDPAFAFYARHEYTRDGATTIHEPTGLPEPRMTRQTRE
jgi:hypothetical protein